MNITWKVSDIFEDIWIALFILWCITFGFMTWPIAGMFLVIWVQDYTTKTYDNLYNGNHLTYYAQKEMGQLHHCKVYKEQCEYYRDGRGYFCDPPNI
jgi:hypothetical protein